MTARLLATVALALALSACKQGENAAGPTDAPAEVLPGSASDAMIAYDTLRSQPPHAAPSEEAGRAISPRGSGPRGDASDAADPAAAGEGAADAPLIAAPPPPSTAP